MKTSQHLFRTLSVCAGILVAVGSAGCGDDKRADTRVAMGVWRVSTEVAIGELPWHLEFSDGADGVSAWLINGPERVPIDEVQLFDDSVALFLPAYNSRINARLDGDDLVGTFTLIKRGGIPLVLPLRAEHGKTHRFVADPKPDIDVTGRWGVMMINSRGDTSRAVGEFRQEGGRVFGTMLRASGDYRFLSGDVDGRSLYLGCLDGGNGYLFKATLSEGGDLIGDSWSDTPATRKWIASRDDHVELPDAATMTYLKPGYDGLAFTFRDTDGNEVSLDDERFQGKVVVVTIGGTWCANCHDEAVFLRQCYEQNRRRGFEVIGLMYEHFREFDKAALQVERFKKKFDIGYTLLVAGYSDSKEAAKTLPMLSGINAYPTSIFIDRRGTVRKIHTGINGPATGEHFDDFKKEFTDTVSRLLDEKA